ncbi:hypothetical protein ACLBWZ_16090 [Brucellaceae bacterium C25G]
MSITELISWILKTLKWFFIDLMIIWIVFILFVVGFVLYFIGRPDEIYIRCVGIFMQFIGFFIAITGLYTKLKEFNVQPIKGWRNARPCFPTKGRIVEMSGSVIVKSKATAVAEIRAGPDSTIERRLQILEENYASLRDDLKALAQENAEQYQGIANDVKLSHQSLSLVENRFKDLHVGGFKYELIGIVLFIGGMLLAGFSPELGW